MCPRDREVILEEIVNLEEKDASGLHGRLRGQGTLARVRKDSILNPPALCSTGEKV